MLKNYLKSAWRSLLKNKGFTFLNVFGLSMGLACCLLIIFYVVDELSYDRFNVNAGRIYRVNEDLKLGENSVQYAVAMPPLAKTLKNDFPYVEDAVRIKNAGPMHVKKDGTVILESRVAFADPSIFNVFTLPMADGDPKTALIDPNSVVITESTALKYFNTRTATGRTLIFENDPYKITGVIKDIPPQSHFHFDFLVSMSTFPDSKSDEWLRSDYNTYVLLQQPSDAKKLQAALPSFLAKVSGDQMRSQLNMDMAAFEKSGSYFRLSLTPLTDIHLKSNRTGELGANSTIQYVYIFSAIALFILLIACVNFMNLSTARSANRAREVGVRKVLGSPKSYLVMQFLTESVLLTLVSALVAVTAAMLLLPAFNQLSGKAITVSIHMLAWLVPALLAIVLLVGVLAGSYPAFYLSAFQPINVLKGKLAAGFKGSGLRGFLVVLQFSISVFLIIGSLVIYQQLHFIQTKDLGYDRHQVVVIKNTAELHSQAGVFKQQVEQLPGVEGATLTGFLPTGNQKGTAIFYKDASFDQKKALFPQTWEVDEDYIKTLNMKMVQGRSFSRKMLTDSSAIIINEAAAKFLGLNDPLNKTLYKSLDGAQNAANAKAYHIIGVVKDFNFASLREVISPVVLILGQNNSALSIRLQATDVPRTLSQVKDKWAALSPGVQMDFSFMDQDFDAAYRVEQRVGAIFIIFTAMAIVIACLGLFGLAAYAAEQRTKEIGIRKILGASTAGIVRKLSVSFIRLVIIAVAVATPLAWYTMNRWLQGFAYRSQIPWWALVMAGSGALLIASITISFQSVKAALANPIKSLRSE